MKKSAFTMIELIATIIILGIIAGIGAEIIAKMYKNYIQSRTLNYLQSQSDITVEQIAKRLQYRIKDTIIARNGTSIRVLNHSDVDESYNVVEWIGYSNEAMLGSTPGWSGFIDLDSNNTNSTDKTLSTPGSDLDVAENIIKVLSNNTVELTNAKPAALIFKHKPAGYYNPAADAGYGWKDVTDVDENYTVKVSKNSNDIFDIEGNTPNSIFEHYHLAHTAYAIVKQGDKTDDFNLTLKYNYQPWNKIDRNNAATSTAILAENVNLFRIKQVGNTIRIKLCLHDGNRSGADRHLVACKEEVIF